MLTSLFKMHLKRTLSIKIIALLLKKINFVTIVTQSFIKKKIVIIKKNEVICYGKFTTKFIA